MVNEQRLHSMIKIAKFDANDGKRCKPMIQYARKDYVALQLLKSFVVGTIAFFMMLGLWVLYSMDALMEQINKNPALCLSKISDEFHISESYFSHMFKENMNVNFSVYLEDLRLTEAAHLIEKGESGINEIALEVGYNNQTSFRRAFKKKYGVTPSSFGVQS